MEKNIIRKILHLDLDAFFCAVEELKIHPWQEKRSLSAVKQTVGG